MQPFRGRILAITFLLCANASGVLAQGVSHGEPEITPPVRPGIGPHDERVRVDPNQMPWRAVGKIQIAAYSWLSSCTGTLIGSATVLTAAHCLFNERAGQYYRANALHFLIGFDGDRYVAQARGISFVIGPGYDHSHPLETLGSDWALLKLDTKLGTPDRILPLRDRPPEPGTKLAIGGYSEDHRYALTADVTCHVLEWLADNHGGHVLRHNCTGTRGVSGAPLLVEDHGRWSVGGIAVAAKKGEAMGLAATVEQASQQQR